MSKLLLFSHSGFSDENSNGITMKNLLSAWSSDEKAEFYCDVQPPDFSAANDYFRVTDMQMLAALAGKKSAHIFSVRDAAASAKQAPGEGEKDRRVYRIPSWLKRRKYSFWLKWLREILWEISPWGHRALDRWINDFSPDVLVYMVGESMFMDRLVLRTVKRLQAPLVLYNCEAYRIIDPNERTGLERAYYRRVEKLYRNLNQRASLEIYNCEPLLKTYSKTYPTQVKQIVAYNSASADCAIYSPNHPLVITYFGNFGGDRATSLLQVADVLNSIDGCLFLDIYGAAGNSDQERFKMRTNIRYHGFVSSDALQGVMEKSDILLHVEGFASEFASKRRYAFSTKIAQCLCAGRALLCYAPKDSASVEYLAAENGALVATNVPELQDGLAKLLMSAEVRKNYADSARRLGEKNHCCKNTAAAVKQAIEETCNGKDNHQ